MIPRERTYRVMGPYGGPIEGRYRVHLDTLIDGVREIKLVSNHRVRGHANAKARRLESTGRGDWDVSSWRSEDGFF